MKIPWTINRKGQVAILGVMLLLGFSLTTSAGLVFFAQHENQNSRLFLSSLKAYAAAESGVEDVAFRLIHGDTVNSTETLTVQGNNVNTTIQESGNTQAVLGDANIFGATRRIEISLVENTVEASFIYGLQVGYIGVDMENNTEIRGSVYSNGSITGGANTTITGDAWVAEGIAATADQSQETQTDTLVIRDVSSRRDAAQSFIPSITANIGQIQLYIRKTGNPSNATIRIVEDNNGAPNNSGELADGTLNSTNVTTAFGWVSVAMDSDEALVAGRTYWLIIDNSSSN